MSVASCEVSKDSGSGSNNTSNSWFGDQQQQQQQHQQTQHQRFNANRSSPRIHVVSRHQQAVAGSCHHNTFSSFHSTTPVDSESPTMMNMKSEAQSQDMSNCAGCGKKITERFLLKALDMYWHEDCLKCSCCDCRLGEVGSTLYTKANLILCKRDYLRLFGSTGYCAACSKVIPAFEMVMRARNNVYHLECFACQQCNHRFCVGDRFYLCDNRILCEYDYEERMVFAKMNTNVGTNGSMQPIKQQHQNMPNSSNGSNQLDSRIQVNGGLPVARNSNHQGVRGGSVTSTSE